MTKKEAIKMLGSLFLVAEVLKVDKEKRIEIKDALNMAIEALQEPERKRGEWIDYQEDGYVECPFCGYATNCEDNKDELHFCFYCGAKMKG